MWYILLKERCIIFILCILFLPENLYAPYVCLVLRGQKRVLDLLELVFLQVVSSHVDAGS